MWEKFKLVLLLLLIGLSLLQTYRLWFGRPLPEEGTLPRYEQAFFTEPPSTSRLIKPQDIIAEHGESTHLFRRGDTEYDSLWNDCFELITSGLEREQIEHVSEEEKNRLLETAHTRIEFLFSYPVPPDIFFSELPVIMNVESVILFWEDERLNIVFKGEDIILCRVSAVLGHAVKEQLEGIDKGNYKRLPGEMELYVFNEDESQPDFQLLKAGEEPDVDEMDPDLDDSSREDAPEPAPEEDAEEMDESADLSTGEEAGPGEKQEEEGGLDTPEESEETEADADAEESDDEVASDEDPETMDQPPETVWSIQVDGRILVPEGNLWAAKLAVSREEIDIEQLVRAFFIDTSMARRIEERDNAVYFTDGERGLRLYHTGRVEYTAPRLERVMSGVTYYSAFRKGAENLSLYGGWIPEAYLDKVESQSMGYRLTWQMFHNGFLLAGENIGSTMVLNEQGVSYYQRKFPVIGEALFGNKKFRSYENALFKAIELDQDTFQDNQATLLSMEPVYFIPSELQQGHAVPAWKIEFKETGKPVYLHWQSLEQLK